VALHSSSAALVERNNNPPASAPAAQSCQDDSEPDLGSAWGITDPKTLAALKKREAKFKGKDAARRQKEVGGGVVCDVSDFYFAGYGDC
jgi:hypothetical protein